MMSAADAEHQNRARTSCDLCRRMKIRCDKRGDKCSHCRARGMSCHVTVPETRKNKVKKLKDLNSIENRIQRMEILLQSSGIILNPTMSNEETSSSETIKEQTAPSPGDDFCNLIVSDAGKQKYIGPSSGFSLLSPRGLAWAQKQTGSSRLADVLSKLKNQTQFWPQYSLRQWVGNSGFTRHLLPSRDVAQQLVNHYFTSFNEVFPLFDRKTFSTYLDRHYSAHPPTTKAWYAALNVVLSIGCRVATESVCSDGVMTSRASIVELSWRFFQNASSVLTDLLFASNELMAVQAVIGMAFIMQAAMNPEATYVLMSIALRLGYAIGFHRRFGGSGLSESELEQRQFVFWVAYTLERSICFRIGRPSAINDEDIGVPIPSERLLDGRSMGISVPSEPDRKFYTFRAFCFISLIESRVYSELYSARSWLRTPEERLQRVSRLDQELQEWKDNIPVELRPEETIQCGRDQRFSVLMLQFSYYNCLTAIHRVSVHHGSWTSRDGAGTQPNTPHSPPTSKPTNSRVYASYALCTSAARSTIHLATQFLGLDSDPRNSLIWLAMYFPISACLTIFTHVLQSPLDPRIEGDVELMERTLTCLSQAPDVGLESVTHVVLNVFGELVSFARDYIKTVRAGEKSQEKMVGQRGPAELPSPPNDQRESIIPPTTGTQSQRLLHPMYGEADYPPFMFTAGCPGDFDFPPIDAIDPDPTLLFAHDWNRVDFNMVEPDWGFTDLGDGELP